MKRLFKGIFLLFIATLMVACENENIQQENDGDKIQISLLFSIGNSPLSIGGPMTGTKGSGEDLFNAIYEGIASGEIIASYELTFKNINTGTSTSISGKWTDNKTISLEKGTYTIYGISTAIGKGIYKDCSLSYQDEVTITTETRSIIIKAQYDCSLLIVNDDSVDKILYYASQTDSTYFSQYQNLTYAFLKSAEDFTQGDNAFLKVYFKNGKSSIVNLGQINIQKGKYYLLENLNNYADAGLVLDIDKMQNGDENEDDYNPTAFFPTTYADKTVAAWYSWTEKDKDKTKTEAVFLFTDNTFVVTKNKVYSKEDGRSPEREIEAVGRYSLVEGDFTNGKATVVISDGTMTIEIKDGKLTTGMGDDVFIKQNNANLPKATEPTGNNNQDNAMEAFFPTTYASKNISGWFSYAGAISEQGYNIKYVASIYFFDDNTYVATNNMLMTGPNGEYPQRVVSASGTYRIIEGSLSTGKLEITIDASTRITVEIENGQLKVIEEGETVIYTKQDNSKLPEPSEPTENGNQGGGEDGQIIEFSITSGKTTRAHMVSNSDIANNGGFKVWGFKNVNTSTDWTTVFDGTIVNSIDYGSTWTYSPWKYWDTSADYKFYAAAPSENANGTITFADNTICVNNVHYAKKTDTEVECMVQRGVKAAHGYNPEKVEFNLSHIMANMIFKIKISDVFNNYTVNLNSLNLEGWNGGNGNFKLNPVRSSNDDISEWTIPVYSPGYLDMVDENGVTLSVDEKVIGDYLLIPQSLDDNCTFKMKYTITGGGYTEVYTYSIKMNQLYQALYTGYKYIATFTINPAEITFDAACLTDWEDGNNTIEIW